MKLTRGFWILALMTACVGCGTTTGIEPSGRVNGSSSAVDVSAYDRVVVEDFRYEGNKVKGYASGKRKAAIDFPDLIASELLKSGHFDTVDRSSGSLDDALVVGGNVERYDEGSAAARLWIGMGTGMAHFDAVVEFRDGSTNAVLGRMTVDRNSWPLGGGIAASQDAGGFMVKAAEKVAAEIAKGR